MKWQLCILFCFAFLFAFAPVVKELEYNEGKKTEVVARQFVGNEVTEHSELIEVLGDGYFKVVLSSGLIKESQVNYTAYKDAESGYCFIRLKSAAINSLLIPLVESDGSYKKYSDSNTNEMTWLSSSKDGAVHIIRDDDTGVEYVIDAGMNSYFVRGTLKDAPTESELIPHT